MINAKGCEKGYTPNKAKRRPDGGDPSPAKQVKPSKAVPPKSYRKQGR